MTGWLQPPRLRIGEDQESENRRVTWLELFYDLVFVVAVSQLAHELSKQGRPAPTLPQTIQEQPG